MSDKIHGHAPRVRRQYNQQTDTDSETEIAVDRDKLLSTVASSAIGAVVGTIVTRSLFGDKNVR